MWRAISLQLAVTLLGSAVAWCVLSTTSAWFYFLGACCAVVPNAVFALRLSLHKGKATESYPVVFFLGEFIKVALTIAGLAWVIMRYQTLSESAVWVSLMLGLVLTLKAPLAIWWLDRNSSKEQAQSFVVKQQSNNS